MTAPELTKEWKGPSDTTALAYLKARGIKIGPNCEWIIPFGFKFDDKDMRAMLFLAQEWDYSMDVYEEPEIIPPKKRRH